ncbi:MAG: hypothetical protein V4539_24785 [Bacteroidota bacterium]
MKIESEKYRWIASMGNKIKSGAASPEEKNEFVDYMYTHGEIDKEVYDNYKEGKGTERMLHSALIMGAISLLMHLLELMVKKNDGVLIPQA